MTLALCVFDGNTGTALATHYALLRSLPEHNKPELMTVCLSFNVLLLTDVTRFSPLDVLKKNSPGWLRSFSSLVIFSSSIEIRTLASDDFGSKDI